jgi:hypothetical protein
MYCSKITIFQPPTVTMETNTCTQTGRRPIERIVLLDFIHRLVSQKTNKIEELKI